MDLIDRQAVIDAIMADKIEGKTLDIIIALGDGNQAKTLNEACDRHAQLLNDLPSAQPVITCDGCKFVGTYDTHFPCRNCVRKEKDYYVPER